MKLAANVNNGTRNEILNFGGDLDHRLDLATFCHCTISHIESIGSLMTSEHSKCSCLDMLYFIAEELNILA